MNKNDNRGLFDIFKKGERDDLTFSEKLAYWFKNVYWCNYKGLTFLALFGIICAIVFVVDVSSQKTYDINYVIAADMVLTEEQMTGLEEYIAKKVTDADGDGEKTAGYQFLPVTSDNTYDQISLAAEEKLFLTLADDSVLMYITDEAHMDSMANDGAFEPLSTFGVESENIFCIEISESEIFKELAIPAPEGGWYMGIKVVDGDRADNEESAHYYEAAASVLKAFAE